MSERGCEREEEIDREAGKIRVDHEVQQTA